MPSTTVGAGGLGGRAAAARAVAVDHVDDHLAGGEAVGGERQLRRTGPRRRARPRWC